MGLDLSHLTPILKKDNDNSVTYFNLEELSILPGYVEQHQQLIVDRDFDEFGKEKVVHFKTKGYQRKGMNSSFYTDFKNDGFYCDLQSVKNAYNYLEADHISTLAELQLNFQKTFIDNFVEGESIFSVSW